MLEGFQPIIPSHPVLMVLGSMPSVTSLEKQEYYGFKHNRFWKILHQYFQMPIASYDEKKEILYNHQILLWDVIASCEREGSLDSAIRKEVVNPIDDMIKQYPSIQAIVCNGKKSYDLLCRHFKQLPVAVYYLPSTSNANRSIKEEALFDQWFSIFKQYNV